MRLKAMSFLAVMAVVLMASQGIGQSIVQVFRLPSTTYWDQAYGLAADSTRLFVSSGTSTAVYNRGFIYTLDDGAVAIDSIATGIPTYNQGLAWDGSYFWYIKGSGSSVRIYKINTSGALVDSIIPPSGWYLGGACWDGTGLWVSNYYPDNFAGLYKYNVTTKTIVDTIPTFGTQPEGIAWDGEFLYYAMDLNSIEPNQSLIYVVDPSTRDTVRTIPMPEPPAVDCNPRGLAWDGHYLWLIAEPVGGSSGRSLYKYDLGGSGTADINLSRDSVSLGYRRIGGTYRDSVLIQNIGTAPLRIDSVGPNASPTWSRSLSFTPPFTIQPNGSATMYVDFQPPLFGQYTWTLPIYSNDPDESVKTLHASGFGIYPAPFIIAPSSYDFASRRVGSSSSMGFSIWNQGGPQLVISSMTFGSTAFRLDSVTFPITIDSLHTTPFRIWFRPTAATTYLDTLKIVSNASNSPVVNLVLSGSGNSSVAPLGSILWEGYVPDNPFTSFDDYQPTSIKQIADVNGDGVNDVIVSSGNYLVTCFNGSSSVTGDVLWMFNTGYNDNNTGAVPWEDALQIRSDVDSDGVEDVVFGCGGGNEFVYTISGRTGGLIWAYGDSVDFNRGDIQAVRVDRDYNGDGVNDVLVSASGTGSGSGGRHAAICLNGLTGAEIFNVTQPQGFTQDIVATATGGAISANNNGAPYVINGFNNSGLPAWTYTAAGTAWSLREIPDINDDGIKDIIGLQGFSGGIFAIDGDAGVQLWSSNLGSSNNGRIVLMDDLDHNGFVDFVLSGPQSLYRIDTRTGGTIWSVPLGSSFIRGVDRLTDVNGDSIPDIAVATQQPGKLMILSGLNGSALSEYVFGTTLTERGDRAAVLASIDGNLSSEVVAGNRQGRIICFSGGPNTTVDVRGAPTTPSQFAVSQNYPNPFNPSTTFKVSMPTEGDLTISIYNIVGERVRDIVYQRVPAGIHEVAWDGRNSNGAIAASGVYFYRVTAGEKTVVQRMLLLK